jgi:hypothetical protein
VACRLELTKHGHCDPVIRAKVVGGAVCAKYCTRGLAELPEAFPLRTATAFPWRMTRECFADARKSRQALCTDPAVHALHEALRTVSDSLDDLTNDWQRARPFAAQAENVLAGCAEARDPAACVRDGYGKVLVEATAAEAAARQAAAARQKDLAAPGDPARADVLARELAGVYKKRFKSGLVDGTTYDAEDILEIVPVGDGAVYFRTALAFYNGHECNAYGVARFSRAGVFVWDGSEPTFDTKCRLEIEPGKDGVRLRDPDSTCRVYCGARGSFEGTEFPRAARREIRYLERLKGSPEYRESLAAFKNAERR